MPRLRGSINDDTITGYNGRDVITGDYGNDQIDGGAGRDRIDGGRGNDQLSGGEGNDVLVSRSDGGETAIAQGVNATNDPDGEIDAATQRVYANQIGLPSNDVLTGGAGADTFRFDTLLSAKVDIIQKHTDPNTGVIDWAGVTGENNQVHDHWLDGIGDDVITDFNAAEGDRIQIRGHTTEVSDIRIVDADGDGAADDTVLQLRSNQGANGGAHNLDLLGTITVLNNQLTANDFTVDAMANLGIVDNISQINEATHPYNPGAAAAPPATDGGGAAGAGAGTGAGDGGSGAGDAGAGAGGGTGMDMGSGSGPGGASGGGSSGGSGSGTGNSGTSGNASSDGSGSGTGAGSGTGTGMDMGGGSGAGDGTGGASGDGSSGSGTGAGTGSGMDMGGGTGAGGDPATPGVSVADQMLQVPAGAAPGQAPTAGDDVVVYGAGDDRGNGGMGNDLVVGLEGDDSLSGGWGDDRIDGGAGDDHVHGNHGDDFIAGRDGDDGLVGDFGNDILVGGAGSDDLRGGRGEDVLLGGADDDNLSGGSGDDILMGGGGNDQVRGGAGNDGLLLAGAIGDYTVAVEGNEVRFTDANGATDVVTGVEQFRFLGTGETYEVQNGQLALTTDTELIDELLNDHTLEQLITEELGPGGVIADPAPAPAADAAAAAPADAAAVDPAAVAPADPALLAA